MGIIVRSNFSEVQYLPITKVYIGANVDLDLSLSLKLLRNVYYIVLRYNDTVYKFTMNHS